MEKQKHMQNIIILYIHESFLYTPILINERNTQCLLDNRVYPYLLNY